MSRRPVSLLLAAGLLAALTACGAPGEAPGSAAQTTAAPDTTLTVLAAASLTSTFGELATTFEEEHPGTSVQLSFAGSADLVQQLADGAPGDVLASADEKNMTKAVDAGVVAGDAVRPFASNTLTIVTPPDNPKQIATFADNKIHVTPGPHLGPLLNQIDDL